MIKGKVHSIETLGALDGPGIRTVVFMKGCPLRCRYCHNPETFSPFSLRQQSQEVRQKKPASGKENADLELKIYSADELFNVVIRYKEYYGKDGGVTASGGEPLLQSVFLAAFFQKLQAAGIRTALDTSGSLFNDRVKKLLDYTDLVILDIKHTDGAKCDELCGVVADGNLPRLPAAATLSYRRGILFKVMEFLEYCVTQKKRVWLRQVIIPNINDTKEQVLELKKLADKYGVEKVELLPYHTMGVSKWKKLGFDYPLKGTPPMDEKVVAKLAKLCHGDGG